MIEYYTIKVSRGYKKRLLNIGMRFKKLWLANMLVTYIIFNINKEEKSSSQVVKNWAIKVGIIDIRWTGGF